jgi:hypothetical protein
MNENSDRNTEECTNAYSGVSNNDTTIITKSSNEMCLQREKEKMWNDETKSCFIFKKKENQF